MRMIITLTMIVIVTTKWMRIITIMIMQHMIAVKGRGRGIWSVNIVDQKDQCPENLNIEGLIFIVFQSVFCAGKFIEYNCPGPPQLLYLSLGFF